MQRFFFLHTNLDDVVSFGLFRMDTGIIINFVFLVAADFGDGVHFGHQGRARRLKVIVGQSVLARPEFLFRRPGAHDVFFFFDERCARRVVEAHFVLDGAILVGLLIVGHDQLVGVLVVLKEVEDSALFHQAGNKIERGFAILYAVFALGKGTLQIAFEILEAVKAENSLHNLRNGHILENAAVGGAGKEPQPGNNFGAIVAEAIIAAHAGKAAYITVPIAFLAAGEMKRNRDLLSDNVFECYGMILRK